jgi:recombination protein RecR
MRYPKHFMRVIEVLKKFPGIGNRSAERFAFHLLSRPKSEHEEMAEALRLIHSQLARCTECGCLIEQGTPCSFCTEDRQRQGSICVIASPREAFAIDSTREYHGLYHVLGGVLSPLEGKTPQTLSIPKLKERIQKHQIREVVVALDSTLEGDATAHFLKRELEPFTVHISRLALGLPMGSSLDYIDGGTLARAFTGRAKF